MAASPSMSTTLLTSLNRLESALTSLTDSITSYAPSPAAARDLLAADSALSASLSQLATHQANHAKLQQLHSVSDELASQFKAGMQTLASLRAEIAGVPISLPPPLPLSGTSDSAGAQEPDGDTGTARPLSPRTLLSFARNTSRFAPPPSFKPPSALRAEADAQASFPSSSFQPSVPEIQTTQPPPPSQPSPSQPTQPTAPATALPSALPSPSPEPNASAGASGLVSPPAADPSQPQPSQSSRPTAPQNPALAQLNPADLAWLDPVTQVAYTPWPSEEMVARSGLARVQGWRGAVFEAGTGQDEGEEEGEKVEEGRMEMGMEGLERPVAGVEGRGEEPKPRVFTGLDFLEEDEE